jgi:hypothetical protein
LIAVIFLLCLPAFGQQEDSVILQNLHRMRLKQQDEEVVVRALIFKDAQRDGRCTPVQQTRARLREVGRDKNNMGNDITINAGTEQLNVTDNHGTINSDVNVQIIKQGGENPCP